MRSNHAMKVGETVGTLQGLMRHMVASCGKSASQVSREMGKVDNFLSVILWAERMPKLGRFVEIAGACGYDLVLVGHGEAFALAATPDGDGGEVTARRLRSVAEGNNVALTLAPNGGERG